jgi:hypothetical protein
MMKKKHFLSERRSHSHYKRNRKIKDTEAKPFLNSKMMIMMEHQVFFFIIKRTRRSIPSQKRTGLHEFQLITKR